MLIDSLCPRCHAPVGVPLDFWSSICTKCHFDARASVYHDRSGNLAGALAIDIMLKQIRNAPYTELVSFPL